MVANRPRNQFATRDLLEIVSWIAVGIGAIAGTILLAPVASRALVVAELILYFAPGMAFGAAAGVVPRRRQARAIWGLLLWIPLTGIVDFSPQASPWRVATILPVPFAAGPVTGSPVGSVVWTSKSSANYIGAHG